MRRSAWILVTVMFASFATVIAVTAGGCGVAASAATELPAAASSNSATPAGRSAIAGGGWVVWTDKRNDRRPTDRVERTDIYGFDLARGREVALCTGRGAQFQPAISGDWLVWVDVPRPRKVTPRTRLLPHARIMAANLRTGERRLVCNARGRRYAPAISGSLIVWADSRNAARPLARGAQTDLYAYDLSTGHERPLCTARGSQDEVAISGEWVVWRDTRTLRAGARPYPDGDIFALNLTNGVERRLTQRTGACWSPDVCDGRAIWKGTAAEVVVVDLTSGSVTWIGDVLAGYFDPQISPRWVVVQTQGDPGAIVSIDLADGNAQRMVPHGSDTRPMGMALSGDLLVWSAGGDIVAYDLARGTRYQICETAGYQSETAVSTR
jgi:TolB protein